MPDQGKQNEQASWRESHTRKGRHRANHSVDNSRSLIPGSQLQYDNPAPNLTSSRGHQRQISETPVTAVPKHMRTSSVQAPFGHTRNASIDAGLPPISSPTLLPRTPDLDNLLGSQPQDPGPQPLPFRHTPQLGPRVFSTPGQPIHDQHAPSDNDAPLVIDPTAMVKFPGLLRGSPGPILPISSPNLNESFPQVSGLTPLLNPFSFPGQPADLQPVVTPTNSPGRAVDKHPLDLPETNMQHFGEEHSPSKKTRSKISPSRVGSEPYTPGVAGTNTTDNPSADYSLQAVTQEWSLQDVEEMLGLFEDAERAKWCYVSDRFSSRQKKLIPPLVCSKKYQDLFGSPESSSLLGSSLFYVAFPSGWKVLSSQTPSLLGGEGPDPKAPQPTELNEND